MSQGLAEGGISDIIKLRFDSAGIPNPQIDVREYPQETIVVVRVSSVNVDGPGEVDTRYTDDDYRFLWVFTNVDLRVRYARAVEAQLNDVRDTAFSETLAHLTLHPLAMRYRRVRASKSADSWRRSVATRAHAEARRG